MWLARPAAQHLRFVSLLISHSSRSAHASHSASPLSFGQLESIGIADASLTASPVLCPFRIDGLVDDDLASQCLSASAGKYLVVLSSRRASRGRLTANSHAKMAVKSSASEVV